MPELALLFIATAVLIGVVLGLTPRALRYFERRTIRARYARKLREEVVERFRADSEAEVRAWERSRPV